MAATATWVKDSPLGLALMYHLLLKGLLSGKNSINPLTLIADISIASYANMVPTFAVAFSTFDGTHTVASNVMVDQTTLTATNIDVYCDVSGSLWADLLVS